jgi:toxin ParE1/3/4
MRVFWAPLAIADLEAIRDFIALDKPDAINLVGTIFRQVESLNMMPNRGRPGRRGTRELIIGSYIAVYRVTDSQVEVLRIRHAAQQWI